MLPTRDPAAAQQSISFHVRVTSIKSGARDHSALAKHIGVLTTVVIAKRKQKAPGTQHSISRFLPVALAALRYFSEASTGI